MPLPPTSYRRFFSQCRGRNRVEQPVSQTSDDLIHQVLTVGVTDSFAQDHMFVTTQLQQMRERDNGLGLDRDGRQ